VTNNTEKSSLNLPLAKRRGNGTNSTIQEISDSVRKIIIWIGNGLYIDSTFCRHGQLWRKQRGARRTGGLPSLINSVAGFRCRSRDGIRRDEDAGQWHPSRSFS